MRLLFLLLIVPCSMAEDRISWPVRSGPTLDGHVAAIDAKGMVSSFDEKSGKGIAWKVAVPDFGHSAPIIGHGKIWLTSAKEDGTEQFVICIDEATGKTLHYNRVFKNEDPEPLGNNINTYASPSCALTEDAVYVHFGSYGTARLDPTTAEIIWQRRDIECRHFRGPGSSPILFDNHLILTFDGIDAQFLTALNCETGKTVWVTERTTDYGDLDKDGKPKRDGDLRKAYSTPSLVEVAGRTQVVSVGSRAAFGYDALTGKEIWGIRHSNFNAAAPAVYFQDLAILNTGSRQAHLKAITLNKTTQGDVTDSHMAWERPKGNSRLAAPLLIDGRVYMITDAGVCICVDAATGKEIWKGRIGGTHVASPITANGLIYFASEEGEVTVIKAGDQFEVVSRNALKEGQRASLAAANGRLYLRTFGHLYAIGK